MFILKLSGIQRGFHYFAEFSRYFLYTYFKCLNSCKFEKNLRFQKLFIFFFSNIAISILAIGPSLLLLIQLLLFKPYHIRKSDNYTEREIKKDAKKKGYKIRDNFTRSNRNQSKIALKQQKLVKYIAKPISKNITIQQCPKKITNQRTHFQN